MRLIASYITGLLFGLGISLSGMANPAKVLNFFDLAGTWDPSLALVMGGAVLVTFFGYRFVLRRDQPVLESAFRLPTSARIDLPLVTGAIIFGIGWGLAGFCPGGALPVLGTGRSEVLLFTASLLAGMLITRVFLSRRQ